MIFKNVSGEAREIPVLGITVGKGEEFEATGDIAKGLQGQAHFERVADKPSTTDKKES